MCALQVHLSHNNITLVGAHALYRAAAKYPRRAQCTRAALVRQVSRLQHAPRVMTSVKIRPPTLSACPWPTPGFTSQLVRLGTSRQGRLLYLPMTGARKNDTSKLVLRPYLNFHRP